VPQSLQAYFQKVRPVGKCDAEDGRLVAQMLLDLVDSKPKDLAHAIREFANVTAMLRECSCAHMGELLAAMLVAVNTVSNSTGVAVRLAAQDPACLTAEQAIALGGMLAARARSSHGAAVAVLQAVDSHPALCTTKAQHAWFVPMLEVLLVPPEAAESRQFGIVRQLSRQLSAIVTPQATAHAPSFTDFDSVVCEEDPTSCDHISPL
jgi:hypothetical protein